MSYFTIAHLGISTHLSKFRQIRPLLHLFSNSVAYYISINLQHIRAVLKPQLVFLYRCCKLIIFCCCIIKKPFDHAIPLVQRSQEAVNVRQDSSYYLQYVWLAHTISYYMSIDYTQISFGLPSQALTRCIYNTA